MLSTLFKQEKDNFRIRKRTSIGPEKFLQLLKMSIPTFDNMLKIIEENLRKDSTCT